MRHQAFIRFRFFPDFKGGQTLVFHGGAKSLSDLASFIRQLGDGKTCSDLLVMTSDDQQVDLRMIDTPHGMFKVKDFSDDNQSFEWRLSSQMVKDFASLIEAVANSSSSGHQYLDSGDPYAITVLVSKGEYNDLFPAATIQ